MMGFPLWWRCGGGGRGGREALCDVESVRLIACIARVGTGVLFFFFHSRSDWLYERLCGWLVGRLVGRHLSAGRVCRPTRELACLCSFRLPCLVSSSRTTVVPMWSGVSWIVWSPFYLLVRPFPVRLCFRVWLGMV